MVLKFGHNCKWLFILLPSCKRSTDLQQHISSSQRSTFQYCSTEKWTQARIGQLFYTWREQHRSLGDSESATQI